MAQQLPPPPPVPESPKPPKRRRAHGLVKWFRTAGNAVLGSDVVLVTLMAVTMTLSAFAVYQATEASDQADERYGELRVLQAEQARQAGYLQTIVDHDLSILNQYCEASIELDLGRMSLLGFEPEVTELISGTLRTQALSNLLLGDTTASCTGSPDSHYSVARAQQQLSDNPRYYAPAVSVQVAEAERKVATLGVDEQQLMLAGLFFTLSLGALISIDVLGERGDRPSRLTGAFVTQWRRWTVVGAAVCFLAGLSLLVYHAVDLLLTLGVLFGLGLGLTGLVLLTRRRRRRPRPSGPSLGGTPQWWAELAGAAAIVTFSMAAVGLSMVSVLEDETTARADRMQASTQQLQQRGQQMALRDLASMSLMVDFDAQLSVAATTSLTDPVAGDAEWDRIKAFREELFARVVANEQKVRDEVREGSVGECRDDVGVSVPNPREQFYEIGHDADAIVRYVREHLRAAVTCDVREAVTRYTGRIWSGHQSTFTVALVVLGLAGFMLALAADKDRSARSSRALLVVGGIGLAVGASLGLTTLPDLVGRANLPSEESISEFADAVTLGLEDECRYGAELDRAIEIFDGYAPAFEQRASARMCEGERQAKGQVSSDLDPAMIPGALADFAQARRLGGSGGQLDLNVGWLYLVDGIQRQDPELLRRGVWYTRIGLAGLEQEEVAPGHMLHMGRMNVAFGLVALGEHDRALEAYREAIRCMEPDARCPGGGVLTGSMPDWIRLLALSDLELLPEELELDDYRRALLEIPEGLPPEGDPAGMKLVLFRQELQISGEGAPEVAAVVWYHRPSEDVSWAMLSQPSWTTMTRNSANTRQPIAAGSLLPTGYYRADVYDGNTRHVLHLVDDSGERQVWAEGDGLVRHGSTALGLSAVVPEEWTDYGDDGVQWHLGPDTGSGLWIRRIEGALPDTDTATFLRNELTTWLHGDRALEVAGLTERDDWFLGYSSRRLVLGDDDRQLRAAVRIESYASDAQCGGALFLAVMSGAAEEELGLLEEIVLERSAESVGILAGDEPHPVVGEGFGLTLPKTWDGSTRAAGGTGNLLVAKDCATQEANLLVGSDPDRNGVAAYLDDTIAAFQDPEQYPGFRLFERLAWDVPGAEAAEVISYTWLPEGRHEPIWQVQLYATNGATITFLTLTTADDEAYADQFYDILKSVELR